MFTLALVSGGFNIGKPELTESDLTQLWLSKGYGVLSEPDQRRLTAAKKVASGESGAPETGFRPASGSLAYSSPAAPVTPRRKAREPVAPIPAERRQSLQEMALRLTAKRSRDSAR